MENLPLVIFDIINFGSVAAVITQLDVFIGSDTVDMRDLRGDHDLPYNLKPGETLTFQADLRRLVTELIAQGAGQPKSLRDWLWGLRRFPLRQALLQGQQKRFCARFWDARGKHHWSKWSQQTLEELSSLK